MFDPLLIVQSAISSFNNIALRSPDFFWGALLCLPIFAVFWFFAPEITGRFLPDSKKRLKIISTWTIAFIAFWLLSHESFNALRDGVSMGISILTAACIFGLGLFVGWHVPSFSNFVKIKEKWRKKADIAAPVVAAGLVGLCALGNWQTAVVQFAAALFGFYTGRLMVYRNRHQMGSEWMVLSLMAVLTFGLIMQPEFFRFGQLGHLTIIHIVFLTAAMISIIASIMMRIVRPTGWLKKSSYKKLMWLSRAFVLFTFVLFLMTENALAFGMFTFGLFTQSFIAIRHRATGDENTLKNWSENMWILSLGLFGLLTAMPAIVCAAIILVRTKSKFEVKTAIRSLL